MLNSFEETKGVNNGSEESTDQYISESPNSAQYLALFLFLCWDLLRACESVSVQNSCMHAGACLEFTSQHYLSFCFT